MLDPNLLRNELDIIAKKLSRRKFELDVSELRKNEKLRRLLQIKIEKLYIKSNFISKEIINARLSGNNFEKLCQEKSNLSDLLNAVKKKIDTLKKIIKDYSLLLPNIPSDDTPEGCDKHANQEVFRWGEPSKFNFTICDHVDLCRISGGINFVSAVKLTGTRFVVMRGQIARMHRALIQFMLDLHTEKHGYTEYYLPYMVNHDSLYSTGHLPKFAEDLFHICPFSKKTKNSIYALIPTAEVPLTNLIRKEIIEEKIIPLRMTAYTTCFRSEAGSYGKDTRGLIRMHQFDKVELVQVVKPEESMQALEEITYHAERVLQLLKLPYRKMLLCAGDIGFASCKTYDLEVWLPTKNNYIEISSCSNSSDFQARRMQARYRSKKDKKINLVHTLNGSGLAVGRTLMAIIENYQLADGRIRIPTILQQYMNGLKYIG